MTRGLDRSQIGVTEQMVETYGETIWRLCNNVQVRRGDAVRELDWAIDIRCIHPTAAGLQDMDDARDHPAIVDPGFAACIARKKRFKPRKLFRRQPKITVAHQWSPFGNLESQTQPNGNPFYGSGA